MSKIPYTITGTVVDATTLSPLVGVDVSYNEDSTLTDTKGYFTLVGHIEENEFITLKISSPNYTQTSIPPYSINLINGLPTETPKLKPNLGVIKLTPSVNSLKVDKLNSLQYSNNTIKSLSPVDSSLLQQKSFSSIINTIKLTLIPMVLGMLYEFGITKANDFLQGKISDLNSNCPSNPEKIKDIIQTRNKLTKQLNNLYKTVDRLTKSLGLINNVLSISSTTFSVLKSLPIPTPPPPTPSLVPIIQDTKADIDQNIKKFTNISSGLLTTLIILRESIQQALDLLAILDENIQKCTTDADLVEINQELRTINNEQQQQQQTIPQVNGFTFDVETEITNDTLKRKRAIAKNSTGVTLLKGEYSFSSSDKILIDELIFYIQSNDLKAN